MPHARALLVAVLLASGCQPPSTGGSDGGNGGRDLVTVPPGCSGTMQGSLNGKFASCGIEVTQEPGDQLFRIVPSAWSGDPIQMLLVALYVAPAVQAKTYKARELGDGTLITVTDRGTAARYDAETNGGSVTGQIDVTFATPPRAAGGDTMWIDTAAHGVLLATMPHDPETAGPADGSVTLRVTF